MTVIKGGNSKHRKLLLEGCLQRVSAEQREYAGACAPSRMTETDTTNTKSQTDGLLELILDPKNLNKAFKQVKSNKGAGGIDGMQVSDLLPYLKEHGQEIIQSIRGMSML
jgi:RNA-directed DNA polymerase